MIKFDKYKKQIFSMRINKIYRNIFKTRRQQIIINSVAAFCIGIFFAWGTLTLVNKFFVQEGVGGLETAAIPDFTESAFDEVMNSSDILLPVHKNTGFNSDEEDLNTVSALLDAEKNDYELELCYLTYRVKKGDMIGFIADYFDITQDTIISVNNIHQSRLLQIGQYLKIPTMSGILYTVRTDGETINSIAEKYEVSSEKCSRINGFEQTASLKAGMTLFIPDAQLDWVTRQEINGDLFKKPIHSRYWLSSYYGWRSSPFTGNRSYHTGIDMAASYGTSVYAALDGKVTTVGFNNIYGNYLIITHHSGYKTLYGHLSAVLVTKDQYVYSSTRIGKVGNTGLSTGPHLHFTVFKFGKTVNPLTLLK